jgi:hypothetical protein
MKKQNFRFFNVVRESNQDILICLGLITALFKFELFVWKLWTVFSGRGH